MSTHNRKRKGNRGSALMIVAYLSSILALVLGVHFYRSSQKASLESRVRENASAAQVVAELASEAATNSLRDVQVGTISGTDELTVAHDWVARNPYGTNGMDTVQRRLAGIINGYEYRTTVRAVREAKQLPAGEAPPQGWLSGVNPSDYDYGNDPIYDFTASYEVVSSARRTGSHFVASNPGQVYDPAFAYEAGVRTVVSLNYNSLFPKLSGGAVLSVTTPSGIGSITPTSGPGGIGGSSETVNSNGVENIFVSGEDHYAVKAATRNVTRESVIEGLAAIPNIPSQLYSVVNDKWDWGRMTMHFRNGDDPNPNVPRTYNFSNSIINRSMIPLDIGRQKDEYVFGGKRYSSVYYSNPTGNGSNLIYGYGRSVTLLEDGTIKETTGAQATPSMYAESALAVGSPENILKFYLNFVPTHPADSASTAAVNDWKGNWTQLPLGYHTKNKTKTTNLRNYRRPLDNRNSDARRRWAVLMWIKDENGRFLARDYTSWGSSTDTTDTMRTSYPIPTSKWTGRYRWAMYGGYGSSSNSDGGHYHIGNFSATNQHASTKQTLHTRMLTLEEAIGYKFYKDSNGIPAKVKDFNPENPPTSEIIPDSMVVSGVPDYYLEKSGGKISKVEYRVNGTQFDEAYQRQNRTDNYGLPITMSVDTDGLYVYDDVTKQTTKYTTLRDFAFKRNISTEAGKEDIREMVLLHMVFEDNPEANATSPNMYWDMGFTVTLVYPKKVAAVDDEDFLAEIFRHWWEGDAEESLTGDPSHKALATVIGNDVIIGMEDGPEKVKAYYEEFGFFDSSAGASNEISSIYTMVNEDNDLRGFRRPVFDENVEVSEVYGVGENGSPLFYGYDDLAQVWYDQQAEFVASKFEDYYINKYSQVSWDVLVLDLDEYNGELLLWRIETAVNMMKSRNPAYSFRQLPDRWNTTNRKKSKLTPEDMHAFMPVFNSSELDLRALVADGWGFTYNKVPGRYAKYNGDAIEEATNHDILVNNNHDKPADVNKTIYFLPGEIVPYTYTMPDGTTVLRSAGDFGGETHHPLAFKQEVVNPNNERPIDAKFIFHQDDMLVDEEKSIADIHGYPEWFTGVHPGDYTGYRNGNLVDTMLAKYPREHRGLIGWHREGPTAEYPDSTAFSEQDYQLVYGDNPQYIVMTKKGFNPYEVVNPTATTEKIAILRPKGDTAVELEQCKPELVPPSKMPTFVIEGEVFSNGNMKGKALDGAGILIVNGNLEIRNTFAYHGILIVMGDIYVVPEKYYAVSKNNILVDEEGNELARDGSTWYYVDENGVRHTSSPLPEWCGELIVQGKVYVGGKIYTSVEKQVSAGSDEIRPAGKIDIRGSKQAVDEVLKLWIKVGPNEGFNAERMGWSSGVSAGDYGLWKE